MAYRVDCGIPGGSAYEAQTPPPDGAYDCKLKDICMARNPNFQVSCSGRLEFKNGQPQPIVHRRTGNQTEQNPIGTFTIKNK